MTLDRASFDLVRKLVYERAAIVLEDGKEYLVESRLEPLAHASGMTVDELCRRTSEAPEALRTAVVEAMTTNETSFFRDHHPFEALRTCVLPELTARRARERKLRIWCAACSSGQEPYSVAILLDEHFPELAGWDVQIHATDIAGTVLKRARAGRYSQLEVNRGLSAHTLVRYFIRDGVHWLVEDRLRRRIRFAELNLVASWPRMEAFDLILLRNVLIYFDAKTKRKILPQIHAQLAPDGFLMLGGSESIDADCAAFERVALPRSGLMRPLAQGPVGRVG